MLLLTVAVPTFNRADLITETLASLETACAGRADRVEVLVVDNASPDATAAAVRAFEGRLPGLRYQRQDVNAGGEANFYRCYEAALGRFVWVVGDDDLVEPEAVDRILAALEEGAGAIVVNYSVWNSNFSECLKGRFLPLDRDQVLASSDDAMAAFGGGLSFTASVVLERAPLVARGRAQFLRHSACGLSFLDSAYCGVSGRRVVCLATPLVRNRGGNSRDLDGVGMAWSAESWNVVFIAGIQKVLLGLRAEGFRSRSVRRGRGGAVRQYVPERLRLLRRHRQPCGSTVRTLLQWAWDVPATWTHALPMLLVPRVILKYSPGWRRRLQGGARPRA